MKTYNHKYFKPILIFYMFALSATFMLIGCGGGSDDDLSGGGCSSLGAKIFNGDVCSQTSRSPVVAIIPIVQNGEQFQGIGICSGTLVTVDDVLTSAHCFASGIPSIVAYAVVISGPTDEVLLINNAAIHPFFNGQVGSEYDIAMATLERVPNPAIGPVPILVSQLTEAGQTMSSFGYGTNNLGEIGVLKSAEMTIDALVGGNLVATLANSDASICKGDSGGPVIQVVDGVASIVGVNSFGANVTSQQCAASGTSISGFVDLQYNDILDFISGYAPDVSFN